MTECNAIIEANNEIDELKRENKKLNELCVRYGFEVGRLEEENEQLKQENEKLQGEYDHLLWLYNGLGCEYDWLKEENEQLKKKNKRSYYIL